MPDRFMFKIKEIEKAMAIDPEYFTKWEHQFFESLNINKLCTGRLEKTKVPGIVNDLYKKALRR